MTNITFYKGNFYEISYRFLCLVSNVAFAEGFYADVGLHPRKGGMNAAIGYDFSIPNTTIAIGPEVEYMDFGEQPHTSTRNRMLNVNVVGRMPLNDDVVGFLKFGKTASKFSEPYNKTV